MQNYDMIIIGAGISGLSMAHYCVKQGLKTLVLEKNEQVGGIYHSHRFEQQIGDFWVELGAHSCFNSYQNLINILRACQLAEQAIPRKKLPFQIYTKNQRKSIFSQLNYLELLWHLPRSFFLSKEGKTVAHYYQQLIGKNNFSQVFSPAFDAVISQTSAEFPADLLFRKKQRDKHFLRNFTFPQGMQQVTDTLVEQSGLQVLTGHIVNEIDFNGYQFTVQSGDKTFRSAFLTLATPVGVTIQLIDKLFPQIAQLLAKIQEVMIETVGVALRKQDVALPPLAGIIGRHTPFYSMVSRDVVDHPDYRGFTFHFRPQRLDKKEQVTQICNVLQVQKYALQQVVYKEQNLPSLKLGHHQTVAEVDKALASKPLSLTGNYFLGVSSEDCVRRSTEEFARIQQQLGMRTE